MPGPISESFAGPGEHCPYVPSRNYPNNAPRTCPCGHHEGFHNDTGECNQAKLCGCKGLPDDCLTPDEDFWGTFELWPR